MIILLISFFLDLILGEICFSFFGHLNLLFICFFISSIPVCYLLSINKKVFLIILIILGLLYDLLFSSIFFINTIFVVLYFLFLSIFYKIKNDTVLNIFLISIIGIICYDFYLFLVLNLLNYSFVINDFYYKIYNSLIMNSLYIILLVSFYKSRIFGFKKSKVF